MLYVMKQPLSSSPELKPKLDALLDVLLLDNSIAATQPPFLIQRGSWISEKTHIQSDKYIYNYIYIYVIWQVRRRVTSRCLLSKELMPSAWGGLKGFAESMWIRLVCHRWVLSDNPDIKLVLTVYTVIYISLLSTTTVFWLSFLNPRMLENVWNPRNIFIYFCFGVSLNCSKYNT